MKIKILTGIVLLVIIQFAIPAQLEAQTKVQWGEPFKLGKHFYPTEIFGYSKDGFCCIIEKTPNVFSLSHQIIIQKMSSDMLVLSSNEIELDEENEYLFEFVAEMNDKVYMFYSEDDTQKSHLKLYAREFDTNSMKLVGDKKEVLDINYSKDFDNWEGKFGFKLSDDETKILVYGDLPASEKSNLKYRATLLDKTLNTVWSNILTIPFKNDRVEVQSVVLDKNDNVFMVTKRELPRTKLVINFKMAIHGYFNNGSEVKDLTPSLEGKSLDQAAALVAQNNDILLVGYYTKVGKDDLSGIYFSRLNPETAEVIESKFNEFTTEFLTAHLSERKQNVAKKKKGKVKDSNFNDYRMSDVEFDDEGNILISAENIVIKMVTTTDSNGKTSSHLRMYPKDVIVSKLNQQGDVVWNSRIVKYQKHPYQDVTDITLYPLYVSYFLFPVGNTVYTLYVQDEDLFTTNTLVRHKDLIGQSYSPILSQLELVLEQYSGANSINREVISRYDEDKFMPSPYCSFQVSKNEVILYKYKGSKYKFGKLTIQ